MSFLRHAMDVGLTPPIEYHAGKASETIVLGEALAMNAGAPDPALFWPGSSHR